ANLSRLGVQLKSGKLAALAYADDLFLLADNDQDLQTLIDLTDDFYGSVGLCANPRKSMTIGNAHQLHIGLSNIESDDKLPYLGITIDNDKRHRLNRSMVDPLLLRLRQSALRPNQKLHLLRHHFIPKFLHRLMHEDFT